MDSLPGPYDVIYASEPNRLLACKIVIKYSSTSSNLDLSGVAYV